mgnify:FL=1
MTKGKKHLTEKQRYQLEAYKKAGKTVKEIAVLLGKCERTIYYELKKGKIELLNSDLTTRVEYCADVAQQKTEYNATAKGYDLKIQNDFDFLYFIQDKIVRDKCSPYAALQFAKREDFNTDICLSTLYKYIRIGLFPNLRQENMPYRRRKKAHKKVQKVCARNIQKPSIEDRDKAIKLRADFGHWEMDTVYSGKNRSKASLLVFTERKYLTEITIKMPDRKAASVVKALDRLERVYGKKKFRQFFKTITVDNGVEFSDYENLVKYDRTKIYYCHPYSSGERGSNENQNKLVRRWIKKGEDIGKYTKQDIKKINCWINQYPRKLFNGLSSNEMLVQFEQEIATDLFAGIGKI